MTPRHLVSLTLPLLLLALTACSGPDAPAPAAAPASPAPAQTPAAPATASPATDAGAPAAAPSAAAPAAPAGPAPVAGVDYVEIANGQPFQPASGRIEVAEVFGYTCPHCAHFEPEFQAWKQRQPGDVAVVQVPAAFGGYWVPYARAFYTAEALGVLPQSHDAMFNAIHVQRSLPVNNNVTAEQIAPFYAQYGVDAKRFTDTFNSFGVDAKINRAKQFAMKAKIEGTPSLVVNGKYTVPVDQRGFGQMLNTVDWLVARERGGAN
ncbi:thiol:disulfide interchange protein DsbA/DsbL [Pseudoxanthomonas sp. 10H]|uniref:thiol:disulfide interchange protein DsbA/DsbL n=1 Tax=Pseudoxanthomonas sp. 10H TaxID=3242729 RepID=UPI003557A2B1